MAALELDWRFETPCLAIAGLKRDLRFALTRPVDEEFDCPRSQQAIHETFGLGWKR
jgi:hypothetical protein